MDVYQRRRLVALSILAVAFIVLVLLIRSCGGDDEPAPVAPVAGATGTEGATALTLAAYIDQADAACLEANTALASVDQADPVAAATEQQQILAGELESLQSLPVPEDAPSGLQDLLAALEDQVDGYRKLATALERGDDTAAAELQAQIDEAAAEAQDAASKVGLDVCGDVSQVGEGSAGGGQAAEETTEAAPVPETGGVTTTTPAPAPAPVAPTEGGVAPPAPAPAPAPAPTDGGGGGGTGSGGVSP
jgi:peptidoglycan DL-endopeptidase CwlO